MPLFNWRRKGAKPQAKEEGTVPADLAEAAPNGAAESDQELVYFVKITYPPQVPEPDSSDSSSFTDDVFMALLKDIKRNIAHPIYLEVEKLQEGSFFMYSDDFEQPSKAVITVSIEDKSGRQLKAGEDSNVEKITNKIKDYWKSPWIQWL